MSDTATATPATRTRKAPAAKAAAATKATAPAATPKPATPKPAAQKAPRAAKGTPRSAKATKAAPAKVVTTDLAADLASGTVRLFRVRKNGTTRRIPFLKPGTPARKKAERVAAMRAAGKTMRQIAEELHESLATVRRELTHLALAQDVEAGADPTTLGYRVERKVQAEPKAS